MSQLTTHVLDTSKGRPAEGIEVFLYHQQNEGWVELATAITNNDGRVADLLEKDRLLPNGLYKIEFLTKNYFDQAGLKTFYPLVPVIFEIGTAEHYHIPLLLSPFGYSTYRGS